MSKIDIILIIFAFFASYTYIIYPIILYIISKFSDNPTLVEDPFYPEVTVLISAYNEEDFIESTIQSIQHSVYPRERITILIGSDGSNDRTNEIVERLAKEDDRINLHVFDRMGKNQVINNLMLLVKTEYVIMMDADITIRRFAFRNLMNRMNDPSVGCIIASLDREDIKQIFNAGTEGGSLYLRYEEKLRYYESKVSSNINAMGALYSFRTKLFKTISNDNVCDDLFILFSIIDSGHRVLFTPYARGYEARKRSLDNETNRRIRLVAGGLSTISEFKNLLNIFKYGIDSFFIWSHKVFRWLSPIFFLLLAVATIFADYDSIVFKVLLTAQIILYGFGLIGWILEKLNIKLKFLPIFVFFVSMNVSTIGGLFRFMKKQQNSIWNNLGFDE